MAALWSTVLFFIYAGSCARLSAGQVTLDPQEFSLGDTVLMTCEFTKDASASNLILTWIHPSGATMFQYDSSSSINAPEDDFVDHLTDYNSLPDTSHSMKFKPRNLCDVGEYTCTVVQTDTQTLKADLREFKVAKDGTTIREDQTVPAGSSGTISCAAAGMSNDVTVALTVGSDVVNADPPTASNLCDNVHITSVDSGYNLADKQSITVTCTAAFAGEQVTQTYTLSEEGFNSTEATTTEASDTMATTDDVDDGPNEASTNSVMLSVQLVLFLVAAYLGHLAE